MKSIVLQQLNQVLINLMFCLVILVFLDTICDNYASGTHLPVANKFDEFVICENNGKSTLMKCKPGFSYNALTTNCEMSK